MKTKRISFLLLVFTMMVSVLAGCGREKDDDGHASASCPNFYCPTAGENTNFNNYGRLEIDNFGNDSCARKLVDECGWHVYNGHNGGYGDTLEVAPSGEQVVLRWAWNNFSWMYFFSGWTGTTSQGIRMGSTLSEVQAAYPGLTYYYGDIYKVENPSGSRSGSAAYFKFKNGAVVEIDVY